jgi:hypothetical protein
MDTRDPLKVSCPKCGAQPAALCTSQDSVCIPHKERRRTRSRQRPGRRLSASPLNLEKKYLVAGSVWSVATNSRDLHASLAQIISPVGATAKEADLSILLHVNLNRESPRWEQPYFRSRDHLFFARYGPDQGLLVDQLSKRVVGSFSEHTAHDVPFLKRTILPVLLGIVSVSIGITPLHCACLAKDGFGLLINGPSGVGKSTLAVLLGLSGFSFVSDDCTYISRSGSKLLAWGLPTTIKLLPDSTRYFEQLSACEPAISLNGELAFEVDPVTTFSLSRSQCCEPRWLILVERLRKVKTVFRRISSADAAYRLCSELEMLPPSIAHQRDRQLRTVHDLARRECWLLQHSLEPHLVAEILTEFCTGDIPRHVFTEAEYKFHDAGSEQAI